MSATPDRRTPYLPIRTVSAETGVNAVTLRAWERRYGLVRPKRTETGHRVYSWEDVARIRRVVELLDRGVSVGQVASVLDASAAQPAADGEEATAWARLTEALLDAITRFDEADVTRVYDEALGTYPIDLVNRRLVIPMLERLGARWADGAGAVAEEHFFQVFVRDKLGARIHHHALGREGPLILTACMPGELHDLGLLFFIVQALDRGLRVVNLGANTPLEELPAVVARRPFAAIVLAANYGATAASFREALPGLVRLAGCPVFVGGRQAAKRRRLVERAGATFLGEHLHEGLVQLVTVARRSAAQR